MLNLTMEQLLEAGVHFGHQKSRWNPKMRPFIFGVRNSVHIIDLRKTLNQLRQAYDIIRDYASKGGVILFVGTKKQIKNIIAEEARRANVFWVSERWLGGTLTNFRTIRQSVQKLRQIEKMFEDGTVKQLTKKEVNILDIKRKKLNKVLSGIRDMERIPDVMFVVDTIQEKTAVAEARKLGIYVMGIVDTNCDPDVVDFPIPGNDDAIKSVRILTSTIADAVLDGKSAGQLGSSFTKTETDREKEQGETVESAGDTSEKTQEDTTSEGDEKQQENQPNSDVSNEQENEQN